jgi:hypothetical protein
LRRFFGVLLFLSPAWMAGSIFCAKNLHSFRGKLASRVRLLKSKIKSSLVTALNSLERWREILCRFREKMDVLALFLHSPSRSRKSSNSKSLITIILQILEILAIHLSLFFFNKNVERNYFGSDKFEKVHGNNNRCWRITVRVKEYAEDFIQRWNSSYSYR